MRNLLRSAARSSEQSWEVRQVIINDHKERFFPTYFLASPDAELRFPYCPRQPNGMLVGECHDLVQHGRGGIRLQNILVTWGLGIVLEVVDCCNAWFGAD